MNTTAARAALAQCRAQVAPADEEGADRDLLARFAGGEEQAFEALVRRHGPMVLGVCRRVLGNSADAEDAFQAAFLALAQRACDGAWRDSVGGWLHEVAWRAAGKLRASAARRAAHERRAGERVAETPVAGSDLQEVLDEEVRRLPSLCREAILRCYFHGQTRAQAARQLGWSLRTLERRLEQGRLLLRDRLTARGATLAVLLAVVPVAVPAALAGQALRAALGETPGRVAELAGAALPGVAFRWKIGLACLLLAGLAAGAGLAFPPRTPPVYAAAPPARPRAVRIEEPLPERAVARLGSTRFRHGFMIYNVAFSRDNRVIASAGAGRGLCLWDARTGRLLHHCSTRRLHSGYSAALSPDGSAVACAEGGSLTMWSARTGKELRRFKGHTNGVLCVALSPKGDVLASGSHDQTVRLWDPSTGRLLHLLKGHGTTVWSLSFREDGRVLASASLDGVIRLWDVQTGRELRTWKAHDKGSGSVTVAHVPGTKWLVSARENGRVKLWQRDTGKAVRVLVSQPDAARGLACSPDGKTVAVGYKAGEIYLVDVETGKERRRWRGHAFRTQGLAFSPDGRTLASCAAWDSTIHLWDPETGKERLPTTGHVAPVDQLNFRADGRRLFSFGRDNKLIEWDLRTRRALPNALPVPSAILGSVAVSPDSKLLAWASIRNTEPAVRLFEVGSGKERPALVGHEKAVRALGFRGDGKRLATADENGTVIVWDLAGGKMVWRRRVSLINDPGGRFTHPLAYSPDGKWLAFGAMDRHVHLLDAATGKEVRSYRVEANGIWLAWSPDSTTVAVAGGYGSPVVLLWNALTGEVVRSWQSPQEGIYGVTFSPDGRLLATSGDDHDSTVRLWEVATAGQVAAFKGHHSAVLPVAFSPDGRTLASGGGDSSVLLWDVTGRSPGGKLRPVRLSPARCAALWEQLADEDAAVAQAAVWELAAGGREGLAYLKGKLPVARALTAKEANRLVGRLDSDDFETRKAATKEAAALGLGAEPALRAALKGRAGLEPRRRVDALVKEWLRSADWLRYRRALAVLEHQGSAEARQVLAALAGGAAGARPTGEAAAALGRMKGE